MAKSDTPRDQRCYEPSAHDLETQFPGCQIYRGPGRRMYADVPVGKVTVVLQAEDLTDLRSKLVIAYQEQPARS
jgi:hypothetical protein